MKEYIYVLLNIKNSLIYMNNSDKELIKKAEKNANIMQEEYIRRISFNLDNLYLSNLLNIIFYRLFKNRVEKKLFNIILDYEEEIYTLSRRIKKRKVEIDKIDLCLKFLNSVSSEEAKKYLSYKKR